jgi:DNA-binding CsgD family transcriptional regulator
VFDVESGHNLIEGRHRSRHHPNYLGYRHPYAEVVLDRIERICAAGGDPTELRLTLLEQIRVAIGFDAYAFVLTDPETSVGVAPLADVPCLPELPQLIRLKYLTPVNRWTALDPVGRLRAATGSQPERSLMWREMLHRYDVGDLASVVFRDRYGCWGFLDLWRIGAAAEYTAAEERRLAAMTGPVTTALRRAQAGTFAGVQPRTERAGPVVLLLSATLEVLGQTPSTGEYLRVLVPTLGEPVPAAAYNVAAQLLAVEAGVDANPPSARVHLADGWWLTLRAARMGADIAVSIEDSSPAERLSVFGRAYGLSDRESDLVRLLASGSDTRDVAGRLHLSEHTVQDHLKSIFAKTSTRNRRTLLSRAIGP